MISSKVSKVIAEEIIVLPCGGHVTFEEYMREVDCLLNEHFEDFFEVFGHSKWMMHWVEESWLRKLCADGPQLVEAWELGEDMKG